MFLEKKYFFKINSSRPPPQASPRPLRRAISGVLSAGRSCASGTIMPLDFVISALVTLLVVVAPIGLIPAFLGVTAGLPPPARRSAALRACLIAFGILTGAGLGPRAGSSPRPPPP